MYLVQLLALAAVDRDDLGCLRESAREVDFTCDHFRLGNALMMYWNSRAVAQFRHKDFQVTAHRQDLLAQFPRHVEATSELTRAQSKLWEALQGVEGVCWNCWFPHGSVYAPWRLIGDKILADTQEVVRSVIDNSSARTKRRTDWRNRSTWAVLHFRCDVTLWKNEQYGFLRHSFLSERLPPATTHMLIVGQVSSTEERCQVVLNEMVGWMRATRGLEVAFQETQVADDWMTLATAPLLFCSSSTFCLTAGMGNPNTVHFPFNGMNTAIRMDGDRIREAGALRSPSFHWVELDYLPGPALADMDVEGFRAYFRADSCDTELHKCVPVGGSIPKEYFFHNKTG